MSKIRIMYAINGDGLGHASRSIPIIQELSKKYNIKIIVSSERTGKFLKKYFKEVIMTESIRFVYENNHVAVYKSISKSTKNLFGKSSNIKKIYDIIKSYKPNVLITDFDLVTANIAKLFNIPIICICNMHSISEMKFPVPKKYNKQYIAQKLPIKIFSQTIDYHIITSFFRYPVKDKNISVHNPPLRKEITSLKQTIGNHILVYQTSNTNNKLISVLKKLDEKFIIYGFDKNIINGNLTYKTTNRNEFFNDLKDCKACIANGGHSFISEALALHKPILSMPIGGTFEQIFNALEIEKLGYGEICTNITKNSLIKFINNCDKYRHNLKNYQNDGTIQIVKKIDEIIKNIG